jgi:dipeptidyl aminopeptidase/acylaminoacyl peptidase
MRVVGRLLAAALLCLPAFGAEASADVRLVDVASHAREDLFNDIKISPDGRYYAATVASAGGTGLVVLSRDSLAVVGRVPADDKIHVDEFQWVSPDRLVFTTAFVWSSRATTRWHGTLYGVDHDGTDLSIVFGKVRRMRPSVVAVAGPGYEAPIGLLLDGLPGDDDHILVSASEPYQNSLSWVERVNVRTGEGKIVAEAPVSPAQFLTDAEGNVRFAFVTKGDDAGKVFHRARDGDEWKLFSEPDGHGGVTQPIGLDREGKVAFLRVERDDGPDEVVRHDFANGARSHVVRDHWVDPGPTVTSGANPAVAIGSQFHGARNTMRLFDEASAEAKLLRSLEAAFPDQQVRLTSTAQGGALALVEVSSAVNPGDFYLFETATLKASLVLSRRTWLDFDTTAPTAPVQLKARDGVQLHGFLTVPVGRVARGLPMVVLPHDGPFGEYDKLSYDPEVQLLADAGYAVLRINFRGSGNYGRRFEESGARQWGLAMQEDLADATRWAAAEGIADPGRICIYGTGYGAYAAMMGVANDPALYRCAAGNAGIYDLQSMVRPRYVGDKSKIWHDKWVGDRPELAHVSPVNLAGNIRVPVFLAAGGGSRRWSVEHTIEMERALKRAKVPLDLLIHRKEPDAGYVAAQREEFYRRLLAFLAVHLGGRTAMPVAAEQAASSD